MPRIESKSDLVPGLIEDVDISRIKSSRAPLRIQLTNIEQLAQSIKEKGLLQPIVIRADDSGYFEIVAGNRRYNACKLLKWRKIPCHIIELDDKEAFEIALIENMQRKTLNALEEAIAFKKYVSDFGWGGVSDLAKKIGRSHAYVVKRIKLLDLPKNVLEAIEKSTISASVAEELYGLDKKEQSELSELISKRNLSLRKVRNLVNNAELIEISSSNDANTESERPSRIFDKAIVSVRSSMSKLAGLMDTIEDDWMVYEVLMQHKNVLHSQIDFLIKQKKKFKRYNFV